MRGETERGAGPEVLLQDETSFRIVEDILVLEVSVVDSFREAPRLQVEEM